MSFSHLIYPLTTRVVGAPQMISQSVSSISPHSPLPSETWLRFERCVHSLMMSSHLFFCLPCLLPPFTVPCKTVLARPDNQETCPCRCSMCFFISSKPESPNHDSQTIVKRRKLQWYGRVSRSSGLAKAILQGTVKGERRKGRQKKRWEDNIKGMDRPGVR